MKELAKSTKSLTSLVGMSNRLKTSSMNPFHTEGMKGLADRSRSSSSSPQPIGLWLERYYINRT